MLAVVPSMEASFYWFSSSVAFACAACSTAGVNLHIDKCIQEKQAVEKEE
jgi:hypothetical protein